MSCGMKVIATPPPKSRWMASPLAVPATVEHLKPGTHDVTFVDEENGNRTLQITLEPGQFQEVYQAMPPSATEHKKEK